MVAHILLPLSSGILQRRSRVLDARGRTMLAYLTTARVTAAKLDEAVRLVREAVLPMIAGRPGCRGCLLLTERAGGQIAVLSLWASAAALTATESRGYLQPAWTRLVPLLAGPLLHMDYEVSAVDGGGRTDSGLGAWAMVTEDEDRAALATAAAPSRPGRMTQMRAISDPTLIGMLRAYAAGDDTIQPILADWLEEQGDLRARAVRQWTITPEDVAQIMYARLKTQAGYRTSIPPFGHYMNEWAPGIERALAGLSAPGEVANAVGQARARWLQALFPDFKEP